MAWCVPHVQGMNFLKKVENSLGKLLGKRTQEQSQEGLQEENPKYKDLGYLAYAQLYNHIHELLKTQELSDEVINASYGYYNDPNRSSNRQCDIALMPLIASVFCNYGRNYGFQDQNNEQWKSLLRQLLLQKNLRVDSVAPSVNISGERETYTFSLLYLALFGCTVNSQILGQGLKLFSALEILEILRNFNITVDPKQGLTVTEIGRDGQGDMQFYSIFDRLKSHYPTLVSPEEKESMEVLIRCLVDLGVETEIWHAYDYYSPGKYIMGEFYGGVRMKGKRGINHMIDESIPLEEEFKDVIERCVAAKRFRSLRFLQDTRQKPLMNLHFAFQ